MSLHARKPSAARRDSDMHILMEKEHSQDNDASFSSESSGIDQEAGYSINDEDSFEDAPLVKRSNSGDAGSTSGSGSAFRYIQPAVILTLALAILVYPTIIARNLGHHGHKEQVSYSTERMSLRQCTISYPRLFEYV